jgi:adhesin/invasin
VNATTSNGKTAAAAAAISVSQSNVVVGSVTVTSSSTAIPVGGHTQVQATVRDIAGQPIVGATVTFNVSSSTAVGIVNPTVSPTTFVTDANGVALTTLTAGNTILTATVTASTGGVSGTTQVGFTAGAAASVSVNPSPNAVKRAGTSTVTIAVVDGNGNPVVNEPVALSLPTPGSGVPTLNLYAGNTNASGLLLVTYTAGANDGTDTVKAVASTGVSSSATITVSNSNAVVGTVTLAAANSSILVGTATVLSATVLDTSGQPISNKSVAFSTNGGTLSAATGTTNASGVATVTLTAGSTAQVTTARAAASNVSGSATVTFTAGAASAVGINASPSAVKPGGSSIVTVAVTDGDGNPVANEPITLALSTIASGTPSLSATSGTTNAMGLLVISYTAGSGSGSDVIRARTSTGVANTVTITVNTTATVIGSVTATANSGSIPVSGNTTIRAVVKDTNGLAVSGQTVSFSTTAGTLSDVTTTDANGIASAKLTAGSQVLTARVDASISGFTSSTTVNFTAGAPNTVVVTASPTSVKPGGTSTISAYVVDGSTTPNPVAGETVTFTITARNSGQPTLAVATAVTNANGLATVTYTAGANSGSELVIASCR